MTFPCTHALLLLLALVQGLGVRANEESGEAFSVTLTTARAAQGLNAIGAPELSAVVDEWTSISSWRYRSVNNRGLFVVHSDHSNTTYNMHSAEHMDDGYAVVTGVNKGADTAVVVAHRGTDTVYTFSRKEGVVQDGFSVAGVNAVALPPTLPDTLPFEEEPLTFDAPSARRNSRCSPERSEDGRVIVRVGILHTRQAASLGKYAANGGSSAIEMEVLAAFAEANAAYSLSGVNIKLVPCANGLIDDTAIEQTSSSRTLRAFETSTGVSAVREAGACDVMVLFASLAALGNSACGLAYMYPGSHGVVAAPCFKDNLSFVHELGHMFGACHGYPAISCGAGANGYGDSINGFRTIEAYRRACRSGTACPRVPRVSNSDSSYTWKGHPIGGVGYDNAWTLNANAESVSKLRC